MASSSDCSSLLVHPPSASGPQRENRPPSTCWYPCHLRWLPISAPAEKHSGHSSISGQSVQRSRRFVTSARQFTQYFFPRSAMLPGSCFLLLEAEPRACALRASPRDLLTSCSLILMRWGKATCDWLPVPVSRVTETKRTLECRTYWQID